MTPEVDVNAKVKTPAQAQPGGWKTLAGKDEAASIEIGRALEA